MCVHVHVVVYNIDFGADGLLIVMHIDQVNCERNYEQTNSIKTFGK